MVKDYNWIEVPPFSRHEFNQCIDLYVSNGWITKSERNFCDKLVFVLL